MSHLLGFRLGASRYALPAELVSEIAEAGSAMHVVPAVEGRSLCIAWVRERWSPVVELDDLVGGVGTYSPGEPSVLLVLRLGVDGICLRVESVDGLLPIDAERVARCREIHDMIEYEGDVVRYVDPGGLALSGLTHHGNTGEPMEERRRAEEPLQLITFSVGGEDFGVDVMRVQRVLRIPELRSIPNSPDFVEGLARVRQSVVPVIDMRKRFGISIDAARDGRLLVVDSAGDSVGLVVDDVPGVVKLEAEAVGPSPDLFKGLASRYLQGIGEVDGRLVILLDLDEILSSTERIELKRLRDAADSLSAGESDVTGNAKEPLQDTARLPEP